jgi:hypothetical protein
MKKTPVTIAITASLLAGGVIGSLATPSAAADVTGLEYVAEFSGQIPVNNVATLTPDCPAGKVSVSGGWVNTSWDKTIVIRSVPQTDLDGWTVELRNIDPNSSASGGSAFVVCADD